MLILVTLSPLLVSCSNPALKGTVPMTNAQDMGRFSVALPEGWQAEVNGERLFLNPEQPQRRYGLYSISLEDSSPKLLPIKTRGEIFFHEESVEDGSGGPEHFLTIWRIDGEKWLVLKAHQQTNPAPNFAEAWSVFESVKVK